MVGSELHRRGWTFGVHASVAVPSWSGRNKQEAASSEDYEQCRRPLMVGSEPVTPVAHSYEKYCRRPLMVGSEPRQILGF